MGHCMAPKLLRCMVGVARGRLHDATYKGVVTFTMQVTAV
jgi:hypothetical protein